MQAGFEQEELPDGHRNLSAAIPLPCKLIFLPPSLCCINQLGRLRLREAGSFPGFTHLLWFRLRKVEITGSCHHFLLNACVLVSLAKRSSQPLQYLSSLLF